MIVICGDALIDFLPVQAEGRAAYVPAPGGSCRNIASGLGRLGAAVGFMGGLSTDFFGDLIADSLRRDGVSLDYAARLADSSTLAFVRLGEGEPAYAFYDQGSAHRSWTRAASPALDDAVTALHVGSLTLIAPPVADEILLLMRAQKGRRVLAIDPNCRPGMTSDLPGYRARLNQMFQLADIIKLSVADLEYLRPGADPERIARDWIAAGASLVVLTRGGDGASAWTREGRGDGHVSVPAARITLVDTVGAGDSFIAAVLFQLERMGLLTVGSLDRIGRAEAQAVLAFAVRVAAITCSRAGADPPWLRELEPPVPPT